MPPPRAKAWTPAPWQANPWPGGCFASRQKPPANHNSALQSHWREAWQFRHHGQDLWRVTVAVPFPALTVRDIGKFPDSNIAESLNRIPGVTISREVTGEGINVSIRGLGTNFTKVTLNGANVAVASTGATDASNANREVDLNWFPTELFTQLS